MVKCGRGCKILREEDFSRWSLSNMDRPCLFYILIAWQVLKSVQFSRSVVSDSLRPHGLQHARPPCPSPTPEACSNSCPSSWWCRPTISSSVIPFSSRLQSCPASGSFQMSRFFASGGQSIGVSASVSVLPMNIQYWFPLGLTGWISVQSKGESHGLLRVKSLLQHHNSKALILQHSAFFIVQLSHPYMTTGETIALTRRTFVCKVMSLLFNMLFRLLNEHPALISFRMDWLYLLAVQGTLKSLLQHHSSKASIL